MALPVRKSLIIETLEPLVLMSASPIEGTEASDWLSGTDGDDLVLALGGDDAIYDPVGTNLVDGGDGVDTLVIYEGTRAEYSVENLADGSLRLNGPGLDGRDVTYEIRNIERVEFTDQLWLLDQSIDDAVPDGGAADDFDVSDGSNGGVSIFGTENGEWISGSDADDIILALGGDDVIQDPVGNNTIDGGDGTDTLVIYEGQQSLYELKTLADGSIQLVGPGLNSGRITYQLTNVERVEFTDGIVWLTTDSGTGPADDIDDPAANGPLSDTGTSDGGNTTSGQSNQGALISGTDGDDWLSGTDADDTINALGGNDVIHAPVGHNTVDGGAGLDTLVIYEGARSDYSLVESVDGAIRIVGPGLDGRQVSWELRNMEVVEFVDGRFSLTDLADSGTSPDVNGDPVDNGSGNANGSSDDDTTSGGSAVIAGTDGDDWLSGTDADDTINALGGNDLIHAPVGNNTVNGGAGYDTLVIYDGPQSAFVLQSQTDGSTLLIGPGLNASQITYTLTSVERIEFTDGFVDLVSGPATGSTSGNDTSIDGAAGDAASGNGSGTPVTPADPGISSRATGSGIEAFHRSGQTFLTWDEDVTIVGESYNVYRFTERITAENLGQATLLTGRWGPLDDDTSVHKMAAPGDPDYFVIDPLGTALGDDTGLFVYTTQEGSEGSFYYAVTTVVNGVENLASPLTTDSALQESVAIAAPVLIDSQNDGHGLLFTQFMDYAQWNPTFQGYAYNYAVALPENYDPTEDYSLKLDLHAHSEHHKYLPASEFGWDTIQVFVDDPGFDRNTTHTWWFGFSADHNYLTDGATPQSGVIENFTQQRVLKAIDEVRAMFSVDDSRIHAIGNSMGASGALTFGIQYGDLFSGIMASQPMTNYSASPLFQNEFIQLWGTQSDNLAVDLNGSHAADIQQYGAGGAQAVGIWDWMNHGEMLQVRRGEPISYLMFGHGKQDNIVDWETQGRPFVSAVESASVAYSAYLDGSAGHSWMGFIGAGVPALGGSEQGLGDWALRNDVSYPSITSSTGSGNLFPSDSGDDGYNLNVDWATSWNGFDDPIVDASDRYEVTIRSLSSSAVADVTPRNTQFFRPAPGSQVVWRSTDAATGAVLDSGVVTVDADGLVKIRDVELLPATGTRLILNA